MKEKRAWYALVADEFLQSQLSCFSVAIEAGVRGLGRIDVIGVRDVGGTGSEEIEVVATEVKSSDSNFMKSLGQEEGLGRAQNAGLVLVPNGQEDTVLLWQEGAV
jgi:hypothetical protein